MDPAGAVPIPARQVRRGVEGQVAHVRVGGVGDVPWDASLPPGGQDGIDGERGEVREPSLSGMEKPRTFTVTRSRARACLTNGRVFLC